MSSVQDYFDRNTRRFLRFGQSGRVGAIRRAVWAPGVCDRDDAFGYVDRRIALELAELGPDPYVVDLGCGVGASLASLARDPTVRGLGVTISPVQVELARRRFEECGLSDRLRCLEADFTHLPEDVGPATLAFAIESFVLAATPRAFFDSAASVLRPGGRLVVVDDFLGPSEPDARGRRWLDEFRRGWRVRSLVTLADADAIAASAGLVRVAAEDWTDWLELRRPRDRAISAMVAVGRHLPLRHPWWLNLLGGNALQMALTRRLIEYRLAVWERPR